MNTPRHCSKLVALVTVIIALLVSQLPALCDDVEDVNGDSSTIAAPVEPTIALPIAAFATPAVSDAPVSQTIRLYYVRDAQLVSGLLADLPAIATEGVHITAPGGGGQPVLLLYGPASRVEQVKRVIATLDVPQPQVELGIWAFQISGTDREKVSRTAVEAQRLINAVSRLVRGYMSALDLYSQEILEANAKAIEMADVAAEADDVTLVCVAPGKDILLPSDRGPHPLALTEIIATLMCARPEILASMNQAAPTGGEEPIRVSVGQLPDLVGGMAGARMLKPSLASALRAGLIPRMGQWVGSLEKSDPEALQCWQQLLASSGDDTASVDLAAALDRTLSADARDEMEMSASAAAQYLIPARVIATVDDPRYLPVVRTSILGFLRDYDAFCKGAVNADHMRMRSADAQSVLQRGERALAGDMERLFLLPLQSRLQQMSGANGGGIGSTSKTSISVLSGSEATVSGSAVSYFNVSMPPQLDASSLASAREFSDALRGYVPRRAKGPGRVIIYVDLNQAGDTGPEADVIAERVQEVVPEVQCWPAGAPGKESLVLVGDEAKAKWAAKLVAKFRPGSSVDTAGARDDRLDFDAIEEYDDYGGVSTASAGAGALGSIAGLPADRLLALAMQFSQQPAVWKALNEGTSLTFTPNILPGGSSAELCVNVNVYHNDGGNDDETTTTPMNRVANHEANTRVYVDALDLFALSSFSLQTTHPQSDRIIPVLGQLPLLGKFFQYKRGPQTVHHESVLMIYSTILPTAADLAATLDWNGEVRQ